MEGPGMSLFQGAGSIHINNSAQDRLEEQEELEDQKRRQKELERDFANAFNDLQDDDEASSVNSSGNFTLDAGQTNGGLRKECHQQRPGLPSYTESLNHLKDSQPDSRAESPKAYSETPKKHRLQHMVLNEDPLKMNFNPYGAGDGQNHYYHQDYRAHTNGTNHFDDKQETLTMLYELKVKEVQELASQMEELRNLTNRETDSLRVRLQASLSDKDKAELSLQQAQHLLASSKHKMMEMEQQMTAINNQLLMGEQEKEQLRLELRAANVAAQEAQQRLHTAQVAHSHDTDALFREQQDRHREDMERLHGDLLKTKNRLEEKEKEIKILERRVLEKDREKDQVVIEKGALINRLASELETAQSRLVSGETARVKEKLAQVTSERNAAREQVKELGSKLEQTAQEFVLCRDKLSASQKEVDNWRSAIQQITADCLPDGALYGEPPSPGKLTTLKEVLGRHKQQMQKLTTLQEELSKRDKRIEHYRKLESELRSKIEEKEGVEMQLNSRMAVLQNKLALLGTNSDGELLDSYRTHSESLQKELGEAREECKNLELKYTELELECDKLKSERGGRATLVQEANADLLRELERYSAQLKDTLRENGELKNLYLQACSSRDSITRELKDLQSKMQKEKDLYKSQEKDYVMRIEKEKQHIEKLTTDLNSNKEDLERANKRISELQKEFSEGQKEFSSKLNQYLEDEKSSMRKELKTCAQCDKHLKTIKNLEEQLNKCSMRLATQESNEELMQELKSKAEFFHQYILERFQRLSAQAHVATNTDPPPPLTPPPAKRPGRDSDDDDDLASKTNLMLKEKEIREQIAEKFTLEIKTIEMNCTKRIKEMENDHLSAVAKLKQLVETKAKEVDTLKEFILAERTKISQILNAKEEEISELIKEHNTLQEDHQKLSDKTEDLQRRLIKYQERVTLVEGKYNHDKEMWKKSKHELEKEKQKLSEKYEDVDSEYQTLKNKYKNVKKTAFMYKDYISKKDEHVNNELSRIKNEYKEIFVRLERQMSCFVSCRIQQTAEPQPTSSDEQNQDYSEMLNRLQNEISALAQTRIEDTPLSGVK